MSKARHDLLARFEALKYETKGGELTVRTSPQPSRAVRMPDPRSAQEVVTSLCKVIRSLETRLAALEQGKFAASGQPASLTVTVRRGPSQAPAPTRPHQPATQTNVRPCPMVQARAQVPDVGYSENNQHTDRVCPIVAATGVW